MELSLVKLIVNMKVKILTELNSCFSHASTKKKKQTQKTTTEKTTTKTQQNVWWGFFWWVFVFGVLLGFFWCKHPKQHLE